MVRGNDGNGHRGATVPHLAVPGRVVVLPVGRLLRVQRVPVHALHGDFGAKVCALPGDLARDDQAPDAVAVPGHVPHGLCDDCQYDCFCVRACVGLVGGDDGVGDVVGRCRGCGGHLLLHSLRHVRCHMFSCKSPHP